MCPYDFCNRGTGANLGVSFKGPIENSTRCPSLLLSYMVGTLKFGTLATRMMENSICTRCSEMRVLERSYP